MNNYNVQCLIPSNDFADIVHVDIQWYITIIDTEDCWIPRITQDASNRSAKTMGKLMNQTNIFLGLGWDWGWGLKSYAPVEDNNKVKYEVFVNLGSVSF